MSVIVAKEADGGDWYMFCREHDEIVTTSNWPDAYEAAMGHICICHPRPHVHHWVPKQNVTSRGFVMPRYWVCACGAASEREDGL